MQDEEIGREALCPKKWRVFQVRRMASIPAHHGDVESIHHKQQNKDAYTNSGKCVRMRVLQLAPSVQLGS